MRATFFCRTGELAGIDHQIGDEATIGQDSGNTLVLKGPVISQTHARIFFAPASGCYMLEDLQSKNGTRLDGVPVRGRERMGDLHIVTLGEKHDFVFVVLPEPEEATLHDRHVVQRQRPPASPDAAPETVYDDALGLKMPVLADAPAAGGGEPPGEHTVYESPSALQVPSFDSQPEPPTDDVEPTSETVYELPDVLAMPSLETAAPRAGNAGATKAVELSTSLQSARAVLEVTRADGSRFRVDLGVGQHDIGRARESAVWIDDQTLTRRHAQLTVAGDGVTIEDQGSRNGTLMEGERLTTPVRLRVGDVVMFGDQVTARLVEWREGCAT